jgi:hypothetical protein
VRSRAQRVRVGEDPNLPGKALKITRRSLEAHGQPYMAIGRQHAPERSLLFSIFGKTNSVRIFYFRKVLHAHATIRKSGRERISFLF